MAALRCCCLCCAEYSQRLFDFCIAFKVQFVVAAAPTVKRPSSPPSLPFSLTPLSAPLPTCLGSAQCNYFKLSLGCRCAASADYLWLPSVCPLTPYLFPTPLSNELLIFLTSFFTVFSKLVHWFSLVQSFSYASYISCHFLLHLPHTFAN